MKISRIFDWFKKKEPINDKKSSIDYMTFSMNIEKSLVNDVRKYCVLNEITHRGFFTTLILNAFDREHDIENFIKKDKTIEPKPYKYRKLHDEMQALGYIHSREVDKIFGYRNASCKFAKKGLKNIRAGRFYFYKKEDVEKYAKKHVKKYRCSK